MAEEKKFPEVGDVVWINGWGGVIGLFERYDTHGKMLMLSWPRESMLGGIWPRENHGFSPVRLGEIKVLSPREIMSKVDLLVKRRDDRIRLKLADEARKAFHSSAIDIFPR